MGCSFLLFLDGVSNEYSALLVCLFVVFRLLFMR